MQTQEHAAAAYDDGDNDKNNNTRNTNNNNNNTNNNNMMIHPYISPKLFFIHMLWQDIHRQEVGAVKSFIDNLNLKFSYSFLNTGVKIRSHAQLQP